MTLVIALRRVVELPGVLKTCGFDYGALLCQSFSEWTVRITKMRENCLKQFDEHWNCLEANNQVRSTLRYLNWWLTPLCAGILPV